MVTGNYSLLYVTVSIKQIIAKVKLKPIACRTEQNRTSPTTCVNKLIT